MSVRMGGAGVDGVECPCQSSSEAWFSALRYHKLATAGTRLVFTTSQQKSKAQDFVAWESG
jgi:hypothetical protein